MSEADIPLWVKVCASIGVGLGGFWWTVKTYGRNFAATPPPSSSPAGDLRILGAALNDHMAIVDLSRAVYRMADASEASLEHLEAISDELTGIRKVMERQEMRPPPDKSR